MKRQLLGLLALLACMGGRAASAFPPTLPEEESAILLCDVSETSMAQDCGPLAVNTAASEREKALIDAENGAPDFLAGAKSGQRVIVLARRSLMSPLDNGNPGRAVPATPANQSVVGDPDWVPSTTSGDVNAYFPDRAMRKFTSGSAMVACTVGPEGDLVGCWMVSDTPPDFAFGVALLKVSALLKMNPVTKSGEPVVGRPCALQASFNPNRNARSFGITLSTAH